MKVLFVTAQTPDMSAAFLWDGLQAALGEGNVVDAVDSRYLASLRYSRPNGKCNGSDRDDSFRWSHRVMRFDEDNFDILVATSTFLRDHDWDWLLGLATSRLKKGGKVVWFETLDAATEFFALPFPVDAVFKREIDPAIQYPYAHKPLALNCAIPARWFDDQLYGWTEEKPYDVFNVSNALTTGHPTRWNSLSATFATTRRTHSLAGCGVLQPLDVYLHVARMFKLTIVAPGGGPSADNPRLWETIAMGGIPVLCGQPCRPHWPWFGPGEIFECQWVEDLPSRILHALDNCDLHAMRLKLKANALENHTTEARARQFLRMVEEDAWRTDGPWRW